MAGTRSSSSEKTETRGYQTPIANNEKTVTKVAAEENGSVPLSFGNNPPQLQPLMDRSAHPGMPVSFTAFAMDPDGDPITYSLVSGPPGATMAGANFSWTPTWSQLGAFTITIRASDPGGLSDTRSCTITVGNTAPQIQPLMDRSAHPGMPVSFTAFANDPDGDQCTFSLVSPPPGATMTAQGNFSWTPTWTQLGAVTITVRATDPGGLFDTKSCIINVNNTAPQLQPLMDKTAHPGMPVSFTAFANDPDGDSVTFSLASGPPGATMNGGNFMWTPTWSQLGAFTISVRATDPGGLFDTKSCIITVQNQAPTMNGLMDMNATVGMPVSFFATAMDPDGDQVTFSLVNPPAGATITANGNFSWTPAAGQTGAFTITVKATDPGGLSDTRSCTITVSA